MEMLLIVLQLIFNRLFIRYCGGHICDSVPIGHASPF